MPTSPPTEINTNGKQKSIVQIMADYGIRAKRDMSKLPIGKLNPQTLCLLCLRGKDAANDCGEFVCHSRSGICVHYFCLLFASGLGQACEGSQCDKRVTANAVYGFKVEDILMEFKRASKLRCNYCLNVGATIGCVEKKCKGKFHFGCGQRQQVLYQYFGSFQAFCRCHKPTQLRVAPITNDENLKPCSICFDAIVSRRTSDTLSPPCCHNTYFHRDCVEKQALSAGMSFFRCPLCNNKEDYIREMLRMGVYVPNRDASWETPEAFADLLERPLQCDVLECRCQSGRKCNEMGTIWSVAVCVFCGLSGAHVECGFLSSLDAPYVCNICCTVWGQTETRKKLKNMGFKSVDLLIPSADGMAEKASENTQVERAENPEEKSMKRKQHSDMTSERKKIRN